jgi:hypothetical protein
MIKKLLTETLVIKTARSEEAINLAAKQGFYPLVKRVVQSDDIKSKFAIVQHEKSGEIKVLGDYRDTDYEGYKLVIDFTWYYPYHFKSPFAAYLIPKDLKKGERVFLEDLIEDYVSWCWNQGDVHRLESSEAIWNGKDFEIIKKKDTSSCIMG